MFMMLLKCRLSGLSSLDYRRIIVREFSTEQIIGMMRALSNVIDTNMFKRRRARELYLVLQNETERRLRESDKRREAQIKAIIEAHTRLLYGSNDGEGGKAA